MDIPEAVPDDNDELQELQARCPQGHQKTLIAPNFQPGRGRVTEDGVRLLLEIVSH